MRKYVQFKSFDYTWGTTEPVYPDLEKGWTGYKQRVGSRYASSKSAEIEIPYFLYKRPDVYFFSRDVYQAFTRDRRLFINIRHRLRLSINADIREHK